MERSLGSSTVLSHERYLEVNNQGQIERLRLTQPTHRFGRNPQDCDLLVPSDWAVISGYHALLKQEGTEYRIFDGNGKVPSTNGLFLGHTRITPSQGQLLSHGMQLMVGQNPATQVQLTYLGIAEVSSTSTGMTASRSVSLRERSVLLGRDPDANLVLDAPIISRRHAIIEPISSDRYVLKDYSTNGVFINDQKVNGSVILSNGDILRIGSFVLRVDQHELRLVDTGDHIRLDVDQLIRDVRDQSGQQRRLLDNISLAIEPGQFVALVGGSGAGKSTLMRTLLGIDPTTSGKVFINGVDLRTNFNIYRTQIGYVPQDDIIHPDLTVAEVLSFAVKLRLPSDTNVEQVVQQTLDQIEMSERRDVLVKQLSGGQRKRVSIGVELLADPKLFFLDEPTSGLDPGLDKKMMQLLRKLASQGRTIILVTHATANITQCDRIVFLGRGGRLCYFGPPDQAQTFFKIHQDGDFADIYNELERGEDTVKEWAAHYQRSPEYQAYVTSYLSIEAQATSPQSVPEQVKPSPWQQLKLLSQRYFKLVIRDPVNLSLALLTAPIGIALIIFAVRDKEPLVLGAENDPTLAPLALRVLFVFTCAAIWVGLSSSLQEIVKEAPIYMRERLVNLGITAYLGSKIVILTLLTIVQATLMLLVILLGFDVPSPESVSWELGVFVTTFLTLLTSTSLGLMVSTLVKNSSQANSALPLLLLPQIIFSGVLFSIEGGASVVSWLMLSRWSVGAYGALVDVNHLVPPPTQLPDGSILPQPFEPSDVYDPAIENVLLNWGVLILHTAVYLAASWGMQKRKDIL